MLFFCFVLFFGKVRFEVRNYGIFYCIRTVGDLFLGGGGVKVRNNGMIPFSR